MQAAVHLSLDHILVHVDEDDYDADRDDNAMSTRARGTTVPLRMRGGGVPVVETVTDEDTEEGTEELEQPQPTQKPIIPTTTKKPQPPQEPKYDPMKDEPPPAIITPSYVPLWKKNEHWGDPCEPAVMCAEPDFIQIYSQNQNGISSSDGLKYDDTFKNMMEVGGDIFAINETHADKMNPLNNRVLESSRRWMFPSKEHKY